MQPTTLIRIEPGRPAVLSAWHDDLDEDTRHRLAVLGLRPGAGVQVVQRTSGGGRLIEVDGGRVALDKRTCARLEVHSEVDA